MSEYLWSVALCQCCAIVTLLGKCGVALFSESNSFSAAISEAQAQQKFLRGAEIKVLAKDQ